MSSGSTVHPESGSTANPQTGERFEQAPEGAHDTLDSKDQRSLKNTLASASEQNAAQKRAEEDEPIRPTDIARSHGNEPSRGAKIDEQIQKEEEEYLQRKGKA